MKKISCILSFLIIQHFSSAQVTYYQGEWTRVNKHELFTGVFKIELKSKGVVNATWLWTFKYIDTNDASLSELYQGKSGKKAVEFGAGTWDRNTRDLFVEGLTKNDPNGIIGLDKYSLKLTADGQVIYGKSNSNGNEDGLFYAKKITTAAGIAAFKAAGNLIKQ